jgi:hypothetical protein
MNTTTELPRPSCSNALVLALALTTIYLSSLATPVLATSVTFTGTGTVGSTPVSAEATLTTGTNSVSITLTNLHSNPTDIVQTLSDFGFTLSTTPSGASMLSSSGGRERTVASNGTFIDGSVVATEWALSASGPDLTLDVIGTPIAPAHTIIGGPDATNTYSNANGSIAGNGFNNPFLAGAVSFLLSVPGVTAETTVTAVTFSFGTTAGNDVPGEAPTPTNTPTITPTNTPTVTPTGTPSLTPTVTPTVTPVPQGGACANPTQCSTGFCVDAVCCDTACTDPAKRCNVSGQVGVCTITPAAAPTLTPWGLVVAGILLVSIAGFALRHRIRSH